VRALVLLLLLLNVAVFGWYSWLPHPQHSAAERPQPGKGTLRLVSETGLPPQPSPQTSSGIADLRACWESEPMVPGDRLDRFTDALRQRGYRVERMAAAGEAAGWYLVSLEEQDTLQAAAQTIERLRAKGIEDLSASPSGDGRLMIIAGHFPSRAQALARKEVIEAKGVHATVTSRAAFNPPVRLTVSGPPGGAAPSIGRWQGVNCQAGEQ